MIAATLLFATLTGVPDSDPLAPVRKGFVQCRGPHEDKSCDIIVSYVPQKGRGYLSVARTRLSNAPDIVMVSQAVVHVAADMVCDQNFGAKGRNSRFLLGGAPVSAEMSIDLHQRIDPGYVRYEGRLVCARYEAKNGMMNSTVWSDGRLEPELGGEFRWVRPNAYKLAPAR